MTNVPVIVCATANAHKIQELTVLLEGLVRFEPRPALLGEVLEDRDTLAGNATLKAQAVCDFVSLPALADDTGLEVDALHGEPGVRSARYAGEHSTDAGNRALLLQRLQGEMNRAARFRTVVALALPVGDVHLFEGTCEGSIAIQERGANGFGYDKLFVPAEGDGRTFAEMSLEEKNHLSHRGRAIAAMASWLRS